MTKTLIVFAALLATISAVQAAPIKAKYCSAVGVHTVQENQLLTDSLGKFARSHALKKLSNQGPNTSAWRSDDSTLQLAVTANVVEQGSIVTLFDTNQPTGPTRTELASYVKQNLSAFTITMCSDIPGFKTPEIK